MNECPLCLSKHIHQISCETIESCLVDKCTRDIKWDSDTQIYRCQDCGYESTKL